MRGSGELRSTPTSYWDGALPLDCVYDLYQDKRVLTLWVGPGVLEIVTANLPCPSATPTYHCPPEEGTEEVGVARARRSILVQAQSINLARAACKALYPLVKLKKYY